MNRETLSNQELARNLLMAGGSASLATLLPYGTPFASYVVTAPAADGAPLMLLSKLAEHTKKESFEEMRHAERVTDRILFLEGLPNFQKLFNLRIGQTVREQFEADLAVEMEVLERLRPGIVMCREKGDATTANLFENILADEEDHIDYLETQLELIEKLGEQLYLSQLVERPPSHL